MRLIRRGLITLASLTIVATSASPQDEANFRKPKDKDAGRLRVLIETDAGGDPDDEQSLVRFLLYTNEFDVEGIICTLARAHDKENLNPERTGLGIVRRQLKAYGEWNRTAAFRLNAARRTVCWAEVCLPRPATRGRR